MTISDIKSQLIGHFLTKDSFVLAEDFSKIEFPPEFADNKREILISAMDDLEELKIVSRIENEKKLVGWLLSAPIGSNGQEVSITLPLAQHISETINIYLKQNNIPNNTCDPLNITEKDLWTLLTILHDVFENNNEKNNGE